MRPEDFDLFSTLVKQRSGLILTKDKAYLLESRLIPVARKWNLKTLEELAQSVRNKRDEQMLRDITEAMTTNESFFFRDQKPFDQFKNVLLPELLRTRAVKKSFRIWSAAASSGQEAYSLAMILNEEAAKLSGWKIDIIGTDLSSEMVERAKSGLYTQFEVQRGLPIQMLIKYFAQIGTDKWQIKEEMRRMVQFREGNLLTDLGPVGVFDVIYCRNVLIYFDQPTKTRVLDMMSHVLAPDGVLFLGGAETVLGITDKFRPLENERGMYVLANRPATGMLPPSAAGAATGTASRFAMPPASSASSSLSSSTTSSLSSAASPPLSSLRPPAAPLGAAGTAAGTLSHGATPPAAAPKPFPVTTPAAAPKPFSTTPAAAPKPFSTTPATAPKPFSSTPSASPSTTTIGTTTTKI